MTDLPPNLPHKLRHAYGLREPKLWPTHLGTLLDRDKFVTASEVGTCARMVKFKKTSPKPRSSSLCDLGYAERGHAVEAWFNSLFLSVADLDDHYDYYLMGEDQRSLYHGYQSGTPDGLIVAPECDGLRPAWVLDIKSIDPRTSRQNLPKPAHEAQIMQNMGILSKLAPAYPDPSLSIKGAILLYVDCSNFNDMMQYEYDFDEDEIAATEKRANDIMGAASPYDLPAEGLATQDGCDYCDYKAECGKQVAAVESAALDLNELDELMKGVFK